MSWVPNKQINHENIKNLMQESFDKHHFTNYGPAVKNLEHKIREIIEVQDNKAVIVTNNGAHALHALVEGLQLHLNKTLKFTTQDFTFPSALQGSLKNSYVVDINEDMCLDLSQVNNDTDGIIVTNLFGHCCDIQKYINYCERNNKILLFDNATCPFTYYNNEININNYGIGCIISLHHTKPIGFGEGGCIIVDKIYEESIRSIINFGYKNTGIRVWNPRGNNYKMSDISAVYINDYISNYQYIKNHHQELYKYFLDKTKDNNKIMQFPNYSSGIPFVNCIVLFLICDPTEIIKLINNEKIEARQYYPSLTGLPLATYKFNHIICLPCTVDMTTEKIDICLKIINENS